MLSVNARVLTSSRERSLVKLRLHLTSAALVCALIAGVTDNSLAGVRLRHLGHASFEWITPAGKKIIIDPYGNATGFHWFDCSFPNLDADLLLVTHLHFDHSAVSRVRRHSEIIAEAADVSDIDYTVRGITGLHARWQLNGRQNVIFILEVAGIRFVHWGDNDPVVDLDLLRELGQVDVLMIPLDESEHLMSLQEDERLISQVAPKVVIPMHYFEPGLTSPCSSLRPIDHWLATQPRVRRVGPAGLDLTPGQLPSTREVWVFEAPRHANRFASVLLIACPA